MSGWEGSPLGEAAEREGLGGDCTRTSLPRTGVGEMWVHKLGDFRLDSGETPTGPPESLSSLHQLHIPEDTAADGGGS